MLNYHQCLLIHKEETEFLQSVNVYWWKCNDVKFIYQTFGKRWLCKYGSSIVWWSFSFWSLNLNGISIIPKILVISLLAENILLYRISSHLRRDWNRCFFWSFRDEQLTLKFASFLLKYIFILWRIFSVNWITLKILWH